MASRTGFFRRLYSTGTSAKPRTSRMDGYRARLAAAYPHADPTKLFASFLVLHELSAILPLFGGYWALSQAGMGPKLLELVKSEEGGEKSWSERWIEEGQDKAMKVGRRYGLFGLPKRGHETPEPAGQDASSSELRGVDTTAVGAEIANFIAAYLVVKAALPIRILLSIRLAAPMANLVGRKWPSWLRLKRATKPPAT